MCYIRYDFNCNFFVNIYEYSNGERIYLLKFSFGPSVIRFKGKAECNKNIWGFFVELENVSNL